MGDGMSHDDLIPISDVEIVNRTDKAIYIEFELGDEPEDGVNRFWIPLSIISNRVNYVETFDYQDDDGRWCEGKRDIVDIALPEWYVYKTEGLKDAIDSTSEG